MKPSVHLKNIITDAELLKCEIWELLRSLEANHNKCDFQDEIRENFNLLLDHLESIELDSELNPDGN